MVAYTSLFHIDFSLEKQIIWLFSRIWSKHIAVVCLAIYMFIKTIKLKSYNDAICSLLNV
jgi:hypothetical protein